MHDTLAKPAGHPVLLVPIRCPQCHRTTEVVYTRQQIATLLSSDAPFRVFSACHDVSWTLSETERAALLASLKPVSIFDYDAA